MVMTARAGTPISVLEAALSAHQQILPFEFADYRALLGTAGESTLGGLVATHISGPRRIRLGALRDHVIGVRLINGRGESISSGGRVMKNVTGLDLVKLMCGAYGTLGILTHITLKVLPSPKAFVTLGLDGLDDDKAIAALSMALGSPYEVSGAAHLPAAVNGGTALTCVRLENWPDAIAYRRQKLSALWSSFGAPRFIEGEASLDVWRTIAGCTAFADHADAAVWRLSTAPSRAAALVANVARHMAVRHFYDWGGGLVWLAVAAQGDCGAGVIRRALGGQGHATLVRASAAHRSAIDVFEPLPPALQSITKGIKQSFDPHGIFNPHALYATI
jgi:glycolate oxidase FAD binding subunit